MYYLIKIRVLLWYIAGKPITMWYSLLSLWAKFIKDEDLAIGYSAASIRQLPEFYHSQIICPTSMGILINNISSDILGIEEDCLLNVAREEARHSKLVFDRIYSGLQSRDPSFVIGYMLGTGELSEVDAAKLRNPNNPIYVKINEQLASVDQPLLVLSNLK